MLASCTTLRDNLKTPAVKKASRFEPLGLVEIERGSRLDRGPSPGSFASPVPFTQTDFFVGTIGGSFGRFDTRTGSFKWKKTFPIGVTAEPAIDKNRVFIGALNSHVQALDVRDGTVLWDKRLSAESEGNLIFAGNTLFVATADNVLWALNADTGQELWTLRRPSPNSSYYWSLRGNTSGVMSPDQKKIYLGFSDGVVVALDATNGQTLWERSFSRPGRFQDADVKPILSPDGQNIYLALPDSSIQVIRTADGLSVDSFPDASGFAPLVDFKDSSIIYSTKNGSIRKYFLATKRMAWELFLDAKGLAGDVVKVNDREALVTSTRIGLHLVNIGTGSLVDEKYLGEGIIARPYTDGSRIFVLTGRAHFIFLRLRPQ